MSQKPHHDAEEDHIIKPEEGLTIFKPRALSIVWGEDTRYWILPDRTSTTGPAELKQVCWLEVNGKTKQGEPPAAGNYEVGFKIALKDDAFGWSNCHVLLVAKVGKRGKYAWRKVPLNKDEQQANGGSLQKNIRLEIKPSDEDRQIYFGMYEVWSARWKGGLLIYEARIKRL
ncbi:protein PHLOEM PROTEIN 2-LIKE A9-like [Ziziphus jujuba]|uniref:Protein PHLOEM PROTEIN 2-LIKE A9-like n=1 Tax=Ziziphus jujuba TaxID=326968 RepID=A0A6P4AAV2_ZIZJJ|nr:protein PHLOEM PROTEIN 2-LIKE A9-like [Ziziphus jujuba]